MRYAICIITLLSLLTQPVMVLAAVPCCCTNDSTANERVKTADACCDHESNPRENEPLESDPGEPAAPCSCPTGLCCVRVNLNIHHDAQNLSVWTLPVLAFTSIFVQNQPSSTVLDITVPPPQTMPAV